MLKIEIFIQKWKTVFLIFLSFAILLSSPSVSAKTTCSGEVCTTIPQKYISDLDNIDAAFDSQYLQPVFQSMVEASVISNNNSGMIGVGYVNRFQVGAGLGAGFVKKDDINVVYKDVNIPKLPNVGIAAAPTAMFAFNLGWLLGKGPYLNPTSEKKVKKNPELEDDEEEDEEEERSILHRFNFYFHGMKANYYTTSDMKAAYGNKPELSGALNVESFGAMMRFQLIEPKISNFDLIGFSGVSIGIGYNMQNLGFDISHQARTNPTINFGELKGSWVARTEFEFASNVRSIPLEVRTGIKLLYFFDIYAGLGVSKNYGTADLHLSRGGPVKLSVDPFYAYNSTLLTSDYYKYYSNNSLNSSNSVLNPEGTLSMDFRKKTKVSSNTNYAIVGMEFNLLFLKLLAEATILEKAYGANVGLKIAF